MTLPAMTGIEALELARCEAVIRDGLTKFVDVGNALLAIRDNRLYRAQYATFEAYCQSQWDMGRSKAYRLIGAAEAMANLAVSPIGDKLPDAESQVRPMAQLAAEQQQAAWAEALQRSDGKPTAAVVEQVVRDFDYKAGNKTNRAGDANVPQPYDACQTPGYAIDPLLPYLPMEWVIWEPAAGEGILVEAFHDASRKVTASDLMTGQNFFEYQPKRWDCAVTNPPYSIKYDWLAHCYELDRPFALLVPVETLGAKSAQELMKQHGFEMMLLDQRVDFKMPSKGWAGSAQFPVFWLCWQILPAPVMFGSIETQKQAFNHGKGAQ